MDFAYQRDDATRAINRLTGVLGVTNRIVLSGPAVPSEEVRDEIEAALLRRAEREADRISVVVTGGTVTLPGAVHSWPEKRAVVGRRATRPASTPWSIGSASTRPPERADTPR